MTPHLVIAGGGITGLAAAYAVATDRRARALGVACTLVEAEPHLGGKVRTERVGDCLIENGPDSFLSTKPWAADLCRALGLGESIVGTTPGRAVFVVSRGRLFPIPDGMMFGVPTRLAPVLRSSLFSPLEKLRMAADLVLPRSRVRDETIGGFLRRRLGDAIADRLAGPLLGGIYAGDADGLSLGATFPLLQEWEAAHRSLVLAALARRRRLPAGTGAPSPMFLTLTGGLGEMVKRLETSLGATRILTGRTVRRIVPLPEGAGSRYAVELDGGESLRADALLLATPAYVTAELLAPLAPSAAEGLRTIPYVSTAAVTLAFRRDEVRHPLDGHGFVVARGEPLSISACTWVSSKWPHRAPPGIALVRGYLGGAGREAIVEADDEILVDRVRADLRATMGIAAAPAFARVTRWVRAMPQYVPGHLDRLAAVEAGMRALPGIALAGAGYRGIGIPDCIRQGTEAAGLLLDALALRR